MVVRREHNKESRRRKRADTGCATAKVRGAGRERRREGGVETDAQGVCACVEGGKEVFVSGGREGSIPVWREGRKYSCVEGGKEVFVCGGRD